MADIAGNIFSGAIPSVQKPQGAGGLLVELLNRKGTTVSIYGKGNSNAGSDDLQHIEQIVAGFAFPQADDNDATHGVISTDETTDDLFTVTCAQDIAMYVLVFGYGQEG